MKIQYVCDYCGRVSFSSVEIEECETKHAFEEEKNKVREARIEEIRRSIEEFESCYGEKFRCCDDECSCGVDSSAQNTKKKPVKVNLSEKDIDSLLKCVFGIN